MAIMLMEKCPRHPRYKGKGKPRHHCFDCINIKVALGLIRKPIAPPKQTHKDKKKYNRKAKHKDSV